MVQDILCVFFCYAIHQNGQVCNPSSAAEDWDGAAEDWDGAAEDWDGAVRGAAASVKQGGESCSGCRERL